MSVPDWLASTPHALAPHLGWIFWSAVIFLALTARPRAAPTALPARIHLLYTLGPVLAGLATLLLSGLLGLILFYRPPLPLAVPYLNFIPAMIGMFAMPGLVMTICAPGTNGGRRSVDAKPIKESSQGLRRWASAGVAGILVIVAVTTNWPGLLILLTATGIGLLPLLFQARAIQGIGLVLIPLAYLLTR
jgi:TctA family transporter